MLIDLGVNWVPARIAWDTFNLHSGMAGLPAEAVFVSPANGNPDAVNPRHAATRGLQALLMLYPGYVLPDDSGSFEFEPLLQTGTVSGATSFFEATRPTPAGPVLGSPVRHEPEGRFLPLAAHVRSKAAARPRPTNVIVVADLDFVSDYFFQVRGAAAATAPLDNVAFVLNAIDVLAGDESFIPIRARRARLRTLDRLDAQTRSYLEQRSREERQAEEDARAALQDARDRLKARVEELQARRDLDDLARQIMVRNLEASEERRLRALENSITAERDARIDASRQTAETSIGRIRSAIRLIAVLVPPIPVMLIGLVMFARRRRREREAARLAGRLRTEP
jgi:ABC-2 type transport system permease protein